MKKFGVIKGQSANHLKACRRDHDKGVKDSTFMSNEWKIAAGTLDVQSYQCYMTPTSS